MKRYFIIFAFLLIISAAGVYAQIPEPNPIVIVPGIGASANLGIMLDPIPTPSIEGWGFVPFVREYDRLVQAFEDAGLVRDEDFFFAFYDWRQSNIDSATDYLIPIIDEALTHSATGKVDIIAHSMGGLVTRSYIQSDSYRDDVDQFIMLGTPNHGSSDVYTLWEGGDVPKNWGIVQRTIIERYIWYITKVSALTSDSYDTIHAFVPSIQELLPTYDYLTDKDTGNSIANADMQEKNLFLSVLNLESNKSKLLTNVFGGVSIIAGEGESTVGDITVVPHDPDEDGKLWVDGKPDPLSPARNDIEGDNRVLLSSALLDVEVGIPGESFQNIQETEQGFFAKLFAPFVHAQFFPPFLPPINSRTISAKHGDLPTESIPEIFSILGLDAPTLTYDPIPEPDTMLTFWFASPIDVQVTGPSGGVITKTENSIPGALYDGANDPLGFKMVVIENPEFGEYIVELLGLAAGGYHMGVGSFNDGGDTDTTVEGDVVQGQRIGYSVSYNDGASVEISEPFTIEEDLFEKFRNTVEAAEMRKHTKKQLIRESYRLEKVFDKGRIQKIKRSLRGLEVTIKMMKGWLIKKEDADELLSILQDIREAI